MLRTEHCRDSRGLLRLMAEADGYIVVRRSGEVPFVLRASDWQALPVEEPAAGDVVSPRALRPSSRK
jgi:hypothetical protein